MNRKTALATASALAVAALPLISGAAAQASPTNPYTNTENCAYWMTPGCVDQSDSTLMGKITANPNLIVRTGPAKYYHKVKTVRKGTRVYIQCWAYGQWIRPGKGRASTDVWDYITWPKRGWVSDAFVNTGRVAPDDVVPNCEDM